MSQFNRSLKWMKEKPVAVVPGAIPALEGIYGFTVARPSSAFIGLTGEFLQNIIPTILITKGI